jgi:hypothetical protein
MYVNMPPKFLTCMKLTELNVLVGTPSTAAAVLGTLPGTTVSAGVPAERAADIMFQLPLPVASAIMLPPCMSPSMLSTRSGTVMKAKDPIRAIMRGTAMTRSEGLMSDEELDIEAMMNLIL